MAIQRSIPADSTEPETFTAYADDVAVDMTGLTPALDVVDKDYAAVALTGAVAWSDAANAEWSYTPDGQLVPANSPYWVRLKVTDGTGAVLVFPNGGEADRWDIEFP